MFWPSVMDIPVGKMQLRSEPRKLPAVLLQLNQYRIVSMNDEIFNLRHSCLMNDASQVVSQN